MISYPYVHPGVLVPAPTPRKPTYKKSMWTEGEDEQLRRAIKEVGFNNWSVVAAMVPGRTGKQCRERWFGMLSPDLAKEDWTPEEDQLLLRLHSEYGNSWAKIAQFIPRRSRISLRNRWGWHVRHQFKGTSKWARHTEQAPPPDSKIDNTESTLDLESFEWDPDLVEGMDAIQWA